MDALDDHGVGADEHAVLHDDRRGGGGLHHTGQHRAGADMAVVTHHGAAAQNRAHIDHGALAHDGADVDDGAHHDDGSFPDLHLLPDDGAGFDTGLDVLHVQQGHAGVPAVVLHHIVGDLVGVGLQNGSQLTPVAENGKAVSAAEYLGGAEVHGARGVDIQFDRGLFLRICDIVDNFLGVHTLLSK